MHHSVPSASVSMCQMRSARSLGAYSSIPSGCSSTWPSESTKSSGAVVVMETPRVRDELELTLEEPADDPLFELRVGRIRELRIEMCRLDEHALPMTEDVEARLAVIGAHAAGADTAERQVGDGDVHHRGVHADTSRARLVENALLRGLRLGEDVQRERPIPFVHEPDRLVDVGNRQDGEDRPEDLLRHDGGAGRDVAQDCRRDVAPFGAGLATDGRCAAGEQLLEALEVGVVDDAGIVGAGGGIGAVEVAD